MHSRTFAFQFLRFTKKDANNQLVVPYFFPLFTAIPFFFFRLVVYAELWFKCRQSHNCWLFSTLAAKRRSLDSSFSSSTNFFCVSILLNGHFTINCILYLQFCERISESNRKIRAWLPAKRLCWSVGPREVVLNRIYCGRRWVWNLLQSISTLYAKMRSLMHSRMAFYWISTILEAAMQYITWTTIQLHACELSTVEICSSMMFGRSMKAVTNASPKIWSAPEKVLQPS